MANTTEHSKKSSGTGAGEQHGRHAPTQPPRTRTGIPDPSWPRTSRVRCTWETPPCSAPPSLPACCSSSTGDPEPVTHRSPQPRWLRVKPHRTFSGSPRESHHRSILSTHASNAPCPAQEELPWGRGKAQQESVSNPLALPSWGALFPSWGG